MLPRKSPRDITLKELLKSEGPNAEGAHTLSRHGSFHTPGTLRQRISGEPQILAPRELSSGEMTPDLRIWEGKDSTAASKWSHDETMIDSID